ncbi:heat shock protein 30 [Xylaria sp. CBS 124048]|nr:heat shock protein 30 [Xylaria sp. CBS 124048]
MPTLLVRANDALNINPPAGDVALSLHGSDWLWAVTAIYAVSALGLFGLSFAARSGERIFHYLFTVALLVGGIAYFAQASDLGFVLVSQVNSSPSLGLTRQIFWPKYVHWVVSFPAAITGLGLLSGVSWATIIFNIFLSWIWVISYLVSAFTVSNYKWGFFAFGTASWLLLAFSTLNARASAKRVGVSGHHTVLSAWANLLWLLYPVAFGLTDGGNRIGVTPGFVFFGVLDVLFTPALSWAFIFLSRRWDYNQLNLAFTRDGRVRDSSSFGDKTTTAERGLAEANASTERNVSSEKNGAGAPAAPDNGVAA